MTDLWRVTRRVKWMMIAAAVVLGMLLVPISGSQASVADGNGHLSASHKREIRGLFNQRYCEIFTIGAPDEGKFLVSMYNTIGLNRCPVSIWDSLDFAAIAKDQGALAAQPNGPRHWLVDRVTGGKPGPVVTLGGLETRKVAATTITTLTQPEPFTVIHIARDNNWIFGKGRRIREVISPNGQRFVMQAYTNTVDPRLNLKTINRIGSNPAAEIPDGWKFRVHKLKHKLIVRANGNATIVRDGLRSVYQRYKPPKRKVTKKARKKRSGKKAGSKRK